MLVRRLLIVLLMLLTGASALAYDLDCHYAFTYFLARKVGFTARQARMIASADASIDTDPNTEPLQIDQVVNPAGDAQTPRIRFHAFPDSGRRVGNDDYDQEAAVLQKQRMAGLWAQALEIKNPGIYLHFEQDTFAHAGYWSRGGHALPGHTEDFISTSPVKAEQMMEATIKTLQRFMRESLQRTPCEPDREECRAMLAYMVHVNQPPSCVGSLLFSPDLAVAQKAVSGQLGGETCADSLNFHFSKEGKPSQSIEVTDALMPELLAGKWVHYEESGPEKKKVDLPDILHFHYHPPQLDAEGTCSWQGETYDDQARTANFLRKPNLPESTLMDWVYQGVEKDLRWRLNLKMHCPLELEVQFLPGLVRWEMVFDGESGYRKSARSWIVDEGKPRTFLYRWRPDQDPPPLPPPPSKPHKRVSWLASYFKSV